MKRSFNQIFKLNKNYFLIFLLLFAIEVFIALYVTNFFVRAYLGDVIVVAVIYCFVKAFFAFPKIPTAISVLIFSFAIEFGQYYNLVDHLGFSHSKLANVVIGNSYSTKDLVAYAAGFIIIVVVEKLFNQKA